MREFEERLISLPRVIEVFQVDRVDEYRRNHNKVDKTRRKSKLFTAQVHHKIAGKLKGKSFVEFDLRAGEPMRLYFSTKISLVFAFLIALRAVVAIAICTVTSHFLTLHLLKTLKKLTGISREVGKRIASKIKLHIYQKEKWR